MSSLGSRTFALLFAVTLGIGALVTPLAALGSQRAAGAPATKPQPVPPAAAPAPASSSDYVIGPDDVLSVLYWREKELSGDVTVRSDGKISLLLLNDVVAAGLTPTQLRDRLTEASRKFVEDPNVTVVVRQMNSRRVFVTGEVEKAGLYPLTGPTTVLQLIALAGGLREYADAENISVLRVDNGKSLSFRFNYREVAARRNLTQNIELKPGDTVVVP